MIKIALVGDIGSGKTYISKLFDEPCFNADLEVTKLYKNNKKCFNKLYKKFPKFIKTFPIRKHELVNLILYKDNNIKILGKIVHPFIREKLKFFIRKNRRRKIVILDIPLFLENKLNGKKDVIIFIKTKKSDVKKRLKKRPNFNIKLINKFKKIQFSQKKKRIESHYIIQNNFKSEIIKKDVKVLKKKILNERSSS